MHAGYIWAAWATVTLEDLRERRVRKRWSAVPVPGVRYEVELLKDGVRDDDRSPTRSSRTTFRWQSLSPATYTIHACSLNKDRVCGA